MEKIIIETITCWVQEGLGDAMKIGRQCNRICPGIGELRWTAGSVAGAFLLGPFGMIAGGERPAESLQSLCRARGKLQYMMKNQEDMHSIQIQKDKIKDKRKKVLEWIVMFQKNGDRDKARKMQGYLKKVESYRFR